MGIRTLNATITINSIANTQGLTKTMSGLTQLKQRIDQINSASVKVDSSGIKDTFKNNTVVVKAVVDKALLLKSAQDALAGVNTKLNLSASKPIVAPAPTAATTAPTTSSKPVIQPTPSQLPNSNSALAGVASSFGKVAGVAGAIVAAGLALKAAIEGVVTLVQGALQKSSEQNAAKLSVAAIIANTKTAGKNVSDSERANILQSARNEAQTLSNKALQYANETNLSAGELNTTFGQVAGTAMSQGFSSDVALQLTRDIAVVAKSAGLGSDQFTQEARSIFSGDIGPDSTVAKILQLDTEKMKELLKNGPEAVAKELSERMKNFIELAKQDALKSYDGTKAILDSVIGGAQLALGDGFNSMSETYNKLLDQQTKEPVGGSNSDLSSMQEMEKASGQVGAIFSFIYYEVLMGIYSMAGEIAVRINEWLSDSDQVASVVSTIWITLETVASILWDVILVVIDTISAIFTIIVNLIESWWTGLENIVSYFTDTEEKADSTCEFIQQGSDSLNSFETGLINAKYGFHVLVAMCKGLLNYIVKISAGIGAIVTNALSGNWEGVKGAAAAINNAGSSSMSSFKGEVDSLMTQNQNELKAAATAKKELAKQLKDNKDKPTKPKSTTPTGGFTKGKPSKKKEKEKKGKTPKAPSAKDLVNEELEPIKKLNELKKAQYEIDVANKLKTREEVAVLSEEIAKDELKQEIALYEAKIPKLKKIEDIKKANAELETARHKLKLAQLDLEAKRILSIEKVREASLTVKIDYLSATGKTFESETLSRDEELLKKREALYGTYSEAIARASTPEDKAKLGKALADDLALLDKIKTAKTMDAAAAATSSFREEFSSLMSDVEVKANELEAFNKKLDKLKGSFADNAPEQAQIDAFRKLKTELLTLSTEYEKLERVNSRSTAFSNLVSAADSAGLSVKETMQVINDSKLFEDQQGKELTISLANAKFVGAEDALAGYYASQNKVLDAQIANRQASLALLKTDSAEYKATVDQLSTLIQAKLDLNAKIPSALKDNLASFKAQVSTELGDFLQGKQKNFSEVLTNSLSKMVSDSLNKEGEKLASMFGDSLKDGLSPALDSLKSLLGSVLSSIMKSLDGGSGISGSIGSYISTGLGAVGSYFGIGSGVGGAATSAAGAATKTLASSNAVALPSAGYSALASLSAQRVTPSTASGLASNDYTKVSSPNINVNVNSAVAISQKQQQQMSRNGALVTQASINRKS